MDTFTRDGLTFDVTDAGPADGRTVILLHGFPEDRQAWDHLIPELRSAGYRVLAPDQRGYSPGARPTGRRPYRVGELEADIVALAGQAGAETFDVVGQDWGSVVAWTVAAHHPERVRSLTTLTVPHPRAFLQAMAHSSQLAHSWYMGLFNIPGLPERLLGARSGKYFAASLHRTGLDRVTAERFARRAARGTLTGPLNWYRALPLDVRTPLEKVVRPTLYVSATGDRFVTEAAAERCAGWVTGPYRHVRLDGATHWLPEAHADLVAPLLLDHLAGT